MFARESAYDMRSQITFNGPAYLYAKKDEIIISDKSQKIINKQHRLGRRLIYNRLFGSLLHIIYSLFTSLVYTTII